jgi:hypothetical protein
MIELKVDIIYSIFVFSDNIYVNFNVYLKGIKLDRFIFFIKFKMIL